MKHISFIAIDWGTTNVRACFFDACGKQIARRKINSEIASNKKQNFAKKFAELVDGLQQKFSQQNLPCPVLACGMVGSAQGWLEVPYLPCPITPTKISNGIKFFQHKKFNIGIVPGLKLQKNNSFNVMRGEETQIFALVANLPAKYKNADIILPGSHCKWVKFRNNKIVDFRTYLSGELFELVSTKSILHHNVSGGKIDFTYAKKYLANYKYNNDWLGNLFAVRAKDLLGKYNADQLLTEISINIIYGEITAAITAGFGSHKNLLLYANSNLAKLYSAILKKLHLQHRSNNDDDLTFSALFNMAKHLKLF